MSEYIIKAADWAIDYKGESLFKGCEEVVRCRDCDHGLFGGKTCDRLDPGFDEYWFEVEPNGFCAWAIRRDV